MELGRFAGEVAGERFSRSLGRSLGAFLGSEKLAWGEALEKPRDFWGRFSPSTAPAQPSREEEEGRRRVIVSILRGKPNSLSQRGWVGASDSGWGRARRFSVSASMALTVSVYQPTASSVGSFLEEAHHK